MVTVVEEFRSRAGRVAMHGRVAAPGIPAGITNYTYYDSQWQAIETRTNGTTFQVGNFAAASTGLGYYGNSYSLTLTNIGSSPSYNLPANTAGFDDTAAEYYYIGGENDQTTGGTVSGNPNSTQPGDRYKPVSWITFSITLTDTSNANNDPFNLKIYDANSDLLWQGIGELAPLPAGAWNGLAVPYSFNIALGHDVNGDIIGVNGDFAGPLNILQNFFQSGITSDSGYDSGTVEVQ